MSQDRHTTCTACCAQVQRPPLALACAGLRPQLQVAPAQLADSFISASFVSHQLLHQSTARWLWSVIEQKAAAPGHPLLRLLLNHTATGDPATPSSGELEVL